MIRTVVYFFVAAIVLWLVVTPGLAAVALVLVPLGALAFTFVPLVLREHCAKRSLGQQRRCLDVIDDAHDRVRRRVNPRDYMRAHQ